MDQHFNSEDRSLTDLATIANRIRQRVIVSLEAAGSGHSAGPLGLADIFTALYFRVLKHRPDEPDWPDRDRLVLSNGHCAPGLYASLATAGYFDADELYSLRRFGSRLQGHPERTKLPGLETTSGPLGSGLSQAAGLAAAAQAAQEHHRFIYVIMGDGELNEGNIWEAAMFANRYRLANLVAIIDRNNIQIDGPTEAVMPLEDLAAKWQAFGWQTITIDGHNLQQIIDACHQAQAVTSQPVVIIAQTIPGRGVDFIEYDFRWHGRTPDSDEAQKALDQLRSLNGKIKSTDHD